MNYNVLFWGLSAVQTFALAHVTQLLHDNHALPVRTALALSPSAPYKRLM